MKNNKRKIDVISKNTIEEVKTVKKVCFDEFSTCDEFICYEEFSEDIVEDTDVLDWFDDKIITNEPDVLITEKTFNLKKDLFVVASLLDKQLSMLKISPVICNRKLVEDINLNDTKLTFINKIINSKDISKFKKEI